MLFTIVKPFSPADGEKWTSYCEWRGMQFERFDSIDGILRPSLFENPENADWNHIVNESFRLHLITDLQYAERKQTEIGKGEVVALRFNNHDTSDAGFLGFDIIDGFCDVSLLTNWGNDLEFINHSLATNALVPDIKRAQLIHRRLRDEFGEDAHAKGCRIISIYEPKANKSLEAAATGAVPQR